MEDCLLDYNEDLSEASLTANTAVPQSSDLQPKGMETEVEGDFDVRQAFRAMQKQMEIIQCHMAGGTSSKQTGKESQSVEVDFDQQIEDILAERPKYPDEDVLSIVSRQIDEVIDSQGEDSHGALFQNIVSQLELDKKSGAPVQDKLASLIKSVLTEKLSDSKLKEKYSKYERPANVEALQTTQVNKIIWDNLKSQTRSRDIRLQKIQLNNIKAMTAIAGLTNGILTSKARVDTENLLSVLADILALLGTANQDFNQFRKDLIKPELKPEYQNLCSKAIPTTIHLFGDNVSQEVRNITEATKVSKRLSHYAQYRFRDEMPFNVAGRLRAHVSAWKMLTSDPVILEWVNGYKIEFLGGFPKQLKPPSTPRFTLYEIDLIDKELIKLQEKGVLERAYHCHGEFLSNIFLRPKKDGSYRMILNLKHLNKHVEYHHFKMDTLLSAIRLMTKNCFMASVDLKDAYYTVAIDESHRKFLRFSWKGQLWQYTCMPNGLASAPRVFTKLLKPLYAQLRSKGHFCMGYIDDSFFQAETREECVYTVKCATDFFRNLGFIVHKHKSVLEPSQTLKFLGFVLDSKSMMVYPTDEKIQNLVQVIEKLESKSSITIRELAQIIGLLVSMFPAVQHGPLFYRSLECDKIRALKANAGNYDSKVLLSYEALEELDWWKQNLSQAQKPILVPDPELVLQTDASLQGWGAFIPKTLSDITVPSENRAGQSSGNLDPPVVAHSSVVRKVLSPTGCIANLSTSRGRSPATTYNGKATPITQKAKTCRLPFVRKYLRNKRVSEQAISIISASWREGTQKQYDTYHRKWSIFCNERKINPFQPSLIEVLDFLTDLFLRGLGYSGLNTARAALSTFLILNGVKTIGQHPLICRFLKGVFELRPPSARYTTTWDVSVVLNFLRELHPLDSLSLKLVTLKLVMLVALVSAQRLQSLQLLDLSTMTKSATSYTFTINQLIKQSRPGYSTTITVFLPDFEEDSRLSVYKVLEHYLILTFPLRQHCSRLFISYVKPYKPVSRDTLGRWIKTVLASAGIDVGVFKAHSTRSAAVSAAKQNSLPVEHILKTAGWKSESTFAKFYNKPISHTDSSFSSAVLTPQDQT
ncbi:hypothetical protein HOLleu_39297 [Holothuria leucospilota]|uniref:Reverse transcriptase domain-containing protein n=1 Tax=Holothuria leucospilota TaxID=206669 RepID=A0A9Q1BCV6_HOLLE|nr:hypothetical protein HOLleu_39297 [Holothuria leucospilota]